MQDFWDEHYKGNEYLYGTKPSEFFRTFIDRHPPGKILLPGAGEGRNAVYAAQAGWEVDAFDISPVAREKALRLAKEEGVEIQYSLQDFNRFDCRKAYYDVVALIFLQLPPAERQRFHQKVTACLKPDGGNLYLIAFTKEQLKYQSGGPQEETFLYSKEALIQDFKNLQIDLLQDEEVNLDEGKGHQGTAHIVKMTALKIGLPEDSDHLTL
jgi:SAM-dependent methyltransferase